MCTLAYSKMILSRKLILRTQIVLSLMGASFLAIGEHKVWEGVSGLLSKDKIDDLGAFAFLGVVHDIWFAPNLSNKLEL